MLISELISRIAAGFDLIDLSILAMASIVAALVMTRWPQITGAALLAYAADLLLRFALEYFTAENVPADFALGLAFARIDDHGLAAALRPFLYFGLIAILFALRRHYGRRR